MKQKPVRSFPAGPLVLAWAVVAGVVHAEAGPPLRMLYIEKPPYSFQTKGEPDGFLYRRVRQILEVARVPVRFEMVPAKRLLAEIQSSPEAVCAFGGYRTSEREQYAHFSRPIHLDRPHLVLARGDIAGRLRVMGSVQRLGRDPELRLTVIDGVSYGPELDRLIVSFAGRVDRSAVSPGKLALMVASGRADFMFVDQDDYEHLRVNDPVFARAGLQALAFPDMPPGMRRHIFCNRRVDAALLERIDDAILRLLP